MTGLKYKLAHKRSDSEKWSASDKAQRRRLVKVLLDMVAQLELEPEEETTIAVNGKTNVNGKHKAARATNHKAPKKKKTASRTNHKAHAKG